MALTTKEVNMLEGVIPGETISKAGSQFLHSLLFSGGKTISNIVFISNILYEGQEEVVSVRDWNEKRFQIVHGVSSAKYPPKAHLTELKDGISEVISELKKGNNKYEIVKKVPKARQLTFPEDYRFFHDLEWHETLKGYKTENRTGIKNCYYHNGEYHISDTFANGYSLPEDVKFLGSFLDALKKLSN